MGLWEFLGDGLTFFRGRRERANVRIPAQAKIERDTLEFGDLN
jgi:hypothetical protein